MIKTKTIISCSKFLITFQVVRDAINAVHSLIYNCDEHIQTVIDAGLLNHFQALLSSPHYDIFKVLIEIIFIF